MNTSKSKKIILYAAGILLVCLVLLAIVWQQELASRNLQVIFFDVGQGDSILIKTPSHQQVLIDGGPDTAVLNKLGRNMPFYDHTIDLVILTHAHADHLNGLVEVLRRYQVKQVLYNGIDDSSTAFRAWQDIIMQKNISVSIASADQVFRFGQTELEVLYPLTSLAGEQLKDLNNGSVVTRLAFQDTSFLFTGDAPEEVEEGLLKMFSCQVASEDAIKPCSALASNVLKVGHHGSRYSSSMEFLQAVSPEYAVISVGADNKFGHPHKLILNRFTGLNIKTLRTDKQGDITMESNGKMIVLD